MRTIDADSLMPLFMEKANTMNDRHGVKLGEEWLLNYNDIKDVIDNAPTIETDMSEYSDKLWQKAYERGKAEARPTEFELIKRAILILCRNIRPDGDMGYFDFEDRRKMQEIYHELVKQEAENECKNNT